MDGICQNKNIGLSSEIVTILGPITLVVILAAVYLASPRFGPHYTSRLTCSKCGKTFNYEWLPGSSFSVIRLGTKRYMRCQLCRRWALFDVVSTIVKPEDDEKGDTSEST